MPRKKEHKLTLVSTLDAKREAYIREVQPQIQKLEEQIAALVEERDKNPLGVKTAEVQTRINMLRIKLYNLQNPVHLQGADAEVRVQTEFNK